MRLSLFLVLIAFFCPNEAPFLNNLTISSKPQKVVSVIYVEVNDNDMRNVAAYELANGQPLFGIANIFAANINYDVATDKAVLSFNPNVQRVLNNRNTQIKPLQDKGIKVCLSVLGNHQGVGIANFSSRAKAKDFARQVAEAINKYGLDGVDLDDEFSEYGMNDRPMPNPKSLIWLLQELRKLMPDKLITYYRIGPSANYLTLKRKQAGAYIDYAYQPYYGKYDSGIVVPGMGKDRISASAINVQEQPLSMASDFAKRTVKDRFGVFMMYNLDGIDRTEYLSEISSVLYEMETKLSGPLF